MKTIGDKLGNFNVVGVKPGALNYDESSFENLNQLLYFIQKILHLFVQQKLLHMIN